MRLFFLIVTAACAVANAQEPSENPSESNPALIAPGEGLETSPADTELDLSDIGDDAIAPADTPNTELWALNSGPPDDSDPGETQAKPNTDSIVASDSESDANHIDAYCPPDTAPPGKLRAKRQTCPPPRNVFIEGNGNGKDGDWTLENDKISEEDSVWDRKQAAQNPEYYKDNAKAQNLCHIIAGAWRPYPLCCLGPSYKIAGITFETNCETSGLTLTEKEPQIFTKSQGHPHFHLQETYIMAPFIQWTIQILFSSIETLSQIRHHANDQLALFSSAPGVPSNAPVVAAVPPSARGTAVAPGVFPAAGVSAVSWGPNRLDIYAEAIYPPGSNDWRLAGIGHKWWDGAQRGPTLDTFEYIGGTVNDPPAAVSWGPNRNHIFWISARSLWSKTLNGSNWEEGNLEWTPLGGNLSWEYPLAALACNFNRLDVFGILEESEGNKSLWRKSWNGKWQDFEHIEGNFLTAPSVISRAPNEISIFIVGNEQKLWDRWWDGKQWGPWHAIGENFENAPRAVSLNPNRIEIFSVGINGVLYHRLWLNGRGWSAWENFGGDFVGRVSVTTLRQNSIHVVGRRTDNLYYYKYWDGTWHPPGQEWDRRSDTVFLTDPTVVSWGVDRFTILGISRDTVLNRNYVFQQSLIAGTWYPSVSGFEKLTPDVF